MAKFTPGPWRIDDEYPDDIRDITGVNLVAQAYCIPSQRGGGHVRMANARLIAQAPAMYAALKEWKVQMSLAGVSADAASNNPIEELLAKVEATIAAVEAVALRERRVT